MKKLFLTILNCLTFFMGWALLGGLLPVPETDNPAVWRFWAELIPLLAVVGFTAFFWVLEKRFFGMHGRKQVQLHLASKPLKSIAVGSVTGAVWLGSVVLILLSTDLIFIKEEEPVQMLWLWLFSVFLNTLMQEMLIRGYIYQLIKSNYNVCAAAVVTTALFTFLHGGAFEAGLVPVLNVLTTSLLLTVVLEYTESLLAPTIMHFIWNAVGAVILGGVSLADDYPHLYGTEIVFNSLLSGGTYGIEGSLITLTVNVVLTAFFLCMHLKKKKRGKL